MHKRPAGFPAAIPAQPSMPQRLFRRGEIAGWQGSGRTSYPEQAQGRRRRSTNSARAISTTSPSDGTIRAFNARCLSFVHGNDHEEPTIGRHRSKAPRRLQERTSPAPPPAPARGSHEMLIPCLKASLIPAGYPHPLLSVTGRISTYSGGPHAAIAVPRFRTCRPLRSRQLLLPRSRSARVVDAAPLHSSRRHAPGAWR